MDENPYADYDVSFGELLLEGDVHYGEWLNGLGGEKAYVSSLQLELGKQRFPTLLALTVSRVGAEAQERQWEYWSVEREGERVTLDELRDDHRRRLWAREQSRRVSAAIGHAVEVPYPDWRYRRKLAAIMRWRSLLPPITTMEEFRAAFDDLFWIEIEDGDVSDWWRRFRDLLWRAEPWPGTEEERRELRQLAFDHAQGLGGWEWMEDDWREELLTGRPLWLPDDTSCAVQGWSLLPARQ